MGKLKSVLLAELSPRKHYQLIKKKWEHIILGGLLDSITTLLALQVFSLSEVNPLINQLIPDYAILVPFVLVEMAFLRYIVVSSVFSNSKYLNFAVYFTLYSLPIWNTANIVLVSII